MSSIQARARLELREKATARDADDVVEIMKCRYQLQTLVIKCFYDS